MGRLLAVALAFGVLSCQKEDTIVNPTKVTVDVKLAARQEYVERGDTAWISLHVSSPSPSTTFLDLGDSSSLQLRTGGLRDGTFVLAFDTLLGHIYASNGSYRIAASVVSNGDTTATATIPVSISDLPPRIALTSDRTSYLPGETVRITLHAEDPTLTAGSVDFKDGTIVTFSRLYRKLDTTLAHVFQANGMYAVQASFTDGDLTAEAYAPLSVFPITRAFQCDLSVGMVWRYLYVQFDNDPSYGSTKRRRGYHEWRILAMTVSGPDTIYQAIDARRDSLHVEGRDPYSMRWVDTTYLTEENLPFNITKSPTRIFFDWPSRYVVDSMKYMPRVVPFSTPDFITVIWEYYPGNWSNKWSVFGENVGLASSNWTDGGNHTWGETLGLLQFIKP